MTDTESKVVAAWKLAASELGIRFTSPFVITLPDGQRQEHLGLVHQFGRRIGTLISVLNEPSEHIRYAASTDYFWSKLGTIYVNYDRDEFIDTLNDRQFFGTENERPAWYTGKSWG